MPPPRSHQVLRLAVLVFLFAFLQGCGYSGELVSTSTADFSVVVTPSNTTVTAGNAAPAFGFTVTPKGSFNGAVSVALTPPTGFTCAPVSCRATLSSYTATNVLTVTPAATVPAGTYFLDFVASSGSISHQVSATLAVTVVVTPTPDFAFAVTPTTSSVTAGSAAPAYSFSATPSSGFTGPITVSTTLPTGFTCVPVACTAALSGNQAANAVQITPSSAVAPGTYTVTFTAISGSLSHQATATITVTAPVTPPDFAFTVTPTTSSVQAGSAAPAYSFSATPSNGFTGTIAVATTLPSGFTCAPVACTAVLSGNQAVNAIQITPSATVVPGSYTVTFTATSGSLSHQATATVLVVAPPPPPLPSQVCAVAATPEPVANSRTGFVFTGDLVSSGLVYDSARNRILVANLEYNELDVISPETMTITSRLSVPQPMGLDLSLDGKTIVIGTRTHYFYRATADTLCMMDRQYLPVLPPFNFNLSPMYPTVMADGSILFRAHDVYSSAQGAFLWTQARGFTRIPVVGNSFYFVDAIVPSGDRTHAYLLGDTTALVLGRYDISTGLIATQVPANGQNGILAVNLDGTRVLMRSGCCDAILSDQNFNTLTTVTGAIVGTVVAEPDFSRFYFDVPSLGFGVITDGSFNRKGGFASSLRPNQGSFVALDGKHRVLSLLDHGLLLLDTSRPAAVPDDSTVVPLFYVSPFSPSTPESGLQTTASGSAFAGAPSMVFFDSNLQASATGVSVTSRNSIKLTAPSFASGCADVVATFPSGYQALAPQAFCYSPVIYVEDGDSAPVAGGTTLTLYLLGLSSTPPTVTVGGIASSNVSIVRGTQPYGPFALQTITAVVPPGSAGDADITVTTSFGSATLPRAFHYVQRVDNALPSGTQPQHLLLDAPRGRILLTDSAHNQLLIYSLSSGALLNTIVTGLNPQGISLTPDGTRLLLVTEGDYKVSVLDASTYTTQQQAVLPTTATNLFGPSPSGPGILVAGMQGNTAYIVTQAGYLQGSGSAYSYSFLYDYNLSTNTITSDPSNLTYFSSEPFFLSSSADGSAALVGGRLGHQVGSALTAGDLGVPVYYDEALASDGHIVVTASQFFDAANHWQNNTAADFVIAPPYTSETFFYGEQFNATGSLLYRATATHVRIYDAQHGNLVRTLEVPGGIAANLGTTTTSPTHLLAIPPSGQQIVTVTNAGLSIFTFAADPLSLATATSSSGVLTLAGSGFSAGTTVKIDGTSAQAAYISTTQLTVTLPTLPAGAHGVTLTNPNGDTYALTLAFTTP